MKDKLCEQCPADGQCEYQDFGDIHNCHSTIREINNDRLIDLSEEFDDYEDDKDNYDYMAERERHMFDTYDSWKMRDI